MLRLLKVALCLAALLVANNTAFAQAPSFESLTPRYEAQVRPLIERLCRECHSPEKHEAELDLMSFRTLTDVRKGAKVWQQVLEMLDTGDMPPKDTRQPTDAERTLLKTWVREYLKVEAKSQAGDPGPVVLRRLSNVEFNNTVRDLTGVDLQPAREFPADNAAGEGFTNAGNAMVMSPLMVTKYLDAAKEISRHVVLLPDGFRFSPSVTRRDWTEELLAQIRGVYRDDTDSRGGTKVNLQGIVFDTNGGGRLPLDRYLETTLVERETLTAGRKTIDAVARERGLSPKYLGILWNALNGKEPSQLLDGLRARWRDAKPTDAAAIAGEIATWQQTLWRFSSVGHIGKVGGPKAWMEPVSPLTTKYETRLKIPASADGKLVTLYLTAFDAGDGNDQDFVVWQQPRLVAAGRPDLLLRDVRDVTRELIARREVMFASAAKCLNAAAEVSAAPGKTDQAELAKRHGVDGEVLAAWLDYLGIGTGGPVKIDSHFKTKLAKSSGYDFVNGWGSDATPLLVANSSDQHVRIPGNMKPHGVAVHPSPTLNAAVGWTSPVAATLRIEGKVQHAHPECGNGVTWSLELRRGATRQKLAAGVSQEAKEVPFGPIEKVTVQPGDLVSLLIGPRDGNHSCDLTAVDLTLTSIGEGSKVWDLARDVSPDVHAANPHADRLGNEGVWHFYTEPTTGGVTGAVIPAGSLLAQWQSAATEEEKQKLASAVQELLKAGPPAAKESPDAVLYRQLASFGGPLFRAVKIQKREGEAPAEPRAATKDGVATKDGSAGASPSRNVASGIASDFGVDPALFGRHPNGQAVDTASLCVKAPSVIEVRLPADLVEGSELVTSGVLHLETGKEGSVQLQVLTAKPAALTGLVPSTATEINANSQWTDNNRRIAHSTPILVSEGSEASRRVEAAFESFRNLFPAALCYSRIVPVDEVVTLTLFYREDHHLSRLMLDDAQTAKLNRLWDELHYVSHDAVMLVDAFEQLMEYATQDADPKVFAPLRKPIHDAATAFRKRLVDTEPQQLDALVDFANRAYRRSLTDAEARDLRGLYAKLRQQDVPHDEAFRLTLARLLLSPAFLYRAEPTGPQVAKDATQATPVSDTALTNRLSYFLWASMPDAELRTLAAENRLHEPDVLVAQAKRMLKDDRVRALSTEFACQWLGIRNFDAHSEKSEQVFPTFNALRGDMYEESVRFFVDLYQRDGSILELLDADHTWLNEAMAKHYEIPWQSSRQTPSAVSADGTRSVPATLTSPGWRRIDGIKQHGRGGILAMATTLAQQSGASRTSPILRGNWVSEVLLGERLPRPPKNVPQLPESESDGNLTVRQLVEKHRSVAACAHCHDRIDPFGFSLEGFDAIGRRRDKDLAGRAIDVNVELKNGTKFSGAAGLRTYLLETRRDDFVRHFCRKLLGYSLARGVQLSDEPLLDEMLVQLKANNYRFSAAVETILRSQQFRYQRGADRQN